MRSPSQLRSALLSPWYDNSGLTRQLELVALFTQPPHSYAADYRPAGCLKFTLSPGNAQSESKHGQVQHRLCHQDWNSVLTSPSQLEVYMLTTVTTRPPQIHIHTYIHTYMYIHIHFIHSSIHPSNHPSIHTYIYTSINPSIHTYIIHTYILLQVVLWKRNLMKI